MSEEERQYCADCGFVLDDDDISNDYHNENDGIICSSCRQNYSECHDCGCLVYQRQGVYVEMHNGYVCQSCFDNDYFQCAYCGNPFYRYDMCEHNGREYCENCYEDEFQACYDCGERYCREEMMWHDDRDAYFCSSCIPNDRVFNYSYKPEPVFKVDVKKEKYRDTTLFFGLELEVENKKERISSSEMVEIINTFGLDLYCKEDSSIDYGFELVSHPFTWNYYKENIDSWNALLSSLSENGFRSYYPGNCGIHIHLNKSAFSTMHLYKFLKMFYEQQNNDFIYMMSQRKNGRGGSCSWKPQQGHCDKKRNIWRAKEKQSSGEGRYTAVNLECWATAEVRIFRGTLKQVSFHKNFEFLMALYNYTKDAGLEKCNYKSFVKYVGLHEAEYKNLAQFLKDNMSKWNL